MPTQTGSGASMQPDRASKRRTILATRADALTGTTAFRARALSRSRWLQLGLGLICMMTISSPQYVWTLLTKPLSDKLGVTLPALQVTFSLLVVLQAFF